MDDIENSTIRLKSLASLSFSDVLCPNLSISADKTDQGRIVSEGSDISTVPYAITRREIME